MKARFAQSILKQFRSYNRLTTLLAAFVVIGVLTASFMIVSGRAAGLRIHWPGSTTAVVSGAPSLSSVMLVAPPCATTTVYVDDSWVGTPLGTDLPGPATNFGCDSFATIQEGINGVDLGGTVIVYDGTYNQASSISLNKSIVLQGPNSAISPNGGSRVAEALITGTANPVLRISSTPVTIEGFKFDSTGVVDAYDPALDITIRKNIYSNGTSNGAFYFLNGPTQLTLDDNHLTNAVLPENDTIFVAGNWNGTTGTVASITNNVIENTPTANASGMNLSNVSGTVSANQFTNLVYYAILLANNSSSMTIRNNDFDGMVNPDPGLSPSWGAGVRTFNPTFTGAVNITSNTFKNSYTGVGIRGVPNDPGADITGVDIHVNFNRFVNNTFGINDGAAGTLDAENNWWGCNYGPGTGGPGCTGTPNGVGLNGTAIVDANPWLVLGTSAAPASILPFTNSTITADMRFNSTPVDTSGSGAIALTPVTFTATEGTMAPPPTRTITAGQATSTFTSTSTNNATACSTVDAQEICTPITVTAPCVTPATVYVDDNWVGTTPGTDPDGVGGPATNFGCDSFATIQDAVTAVPSSGTIIVRAGTYTENLTINKIVTLNGAQVGVAPNDGSWNDIRTIPANESIIHGAMNLSLRNNIIVDGFTLERTATNEGHILIGSGNPTGVGTSSSFNIRNNRIIGTRATASPGSPWAGIHTNFLNDGALPGAQFVSHRNRIVIAGAASGSGILVNANLPGTDGLGATTITETYVASSPGNGFNVNRPGASALISGNRVVNDDIFTFRANNTVISGNTVSGAPQSAISNTGGSTTWSATGNTITDPTAAAVLVGSTFTVDPVSGVTVSGNTVTVNSSLLTNNFSLFDFRGNLTGTNVIQNNSLTMTGVVGGGIIGVYGVRVRGDVRNLTVSGNTLQGGTPGGAGDATLPASSGVFVDTDAVTTLLDLDIQNNIINGWANGVSFFDTVAGLPVAGVPPVQIISNTITGNGTGVRVQGQGPANLNFNRIVGNSANGLNNVDGTVTAENNWWGCNDGPGGTGCDSVAGTVDFNPWLVLGVSASPSSIPPFGNSTITADMRKNSAAVDTSGSGTIPATPVAWSATNGAMSPSPTGTVTAGTASSTFTSNSTSSGTGCAMVDSQLTCANVTVFPTTVTITPAGGAATAVDNDYTRINDAVQAAFAGQTIKLLGTFNWTEANAAASWAKGSDGIAGNADDYSVLVPANLNNVTFTADNLGDAAIQGPGDLAAVNLEGVLVFDGGDNQNWTISNIHFLDFDLSIGMFSGAGGSDAFNNTNITNNYIRLARDLNTTVAPADSNQNIGIHYAVGTNQVITGNTIEIQGDAVSNGGNFASDVGMQSNTSGGNFYDGLQITNNIIRVLNAQDATNPQVILGIWENAHGHTSNITVSGNQFINQAPGNNPATNLQRAFRVTSHSSATSTVTYQNNTVMGANIGFQWLAPSNFAGNLPVRLVSNTITGNRTGVLVQSQGLADLSFNRIVGNTVTGLNNVDGIVTAENNWWGCNDGPGTAGCDSVTGTADSSPWLVLGVSASPNSIGPGGTSTLTADMTDNSVAADTSGLGTLPLTPVSFSATQGTMDPTTGTITAGQASSTFTSTSTSNGLACAAVDNQTNCAPITITSVSFSIDDVTHMEGNGGTTAYTFTITKTGTTALNTSVDYATLNGSAAEPSDFNAISATTMQFLPADTSKQVTVLVNGDPDVEPNEAYTLHLYNPSGATISDADGAGAIMNDDSPTANLALAKLDTPDPVIAGANLTYAVTVTNNGPSEASSLQLSDTLPANTTFVSFTVPAGWTRTDGVTSGGSGTVTATAITLASGGSSQFTLVVNVNSNTPNNTVLSNTATVTTTTTDPDLNNNSATALTAVGSYPDLTITKTHVGNFTAGQTGASYTIRVTNSGTGPTSGPVTVTDQLPVGLTPTAPTGVVNGWTCAINGQQLTCTRSDVLVGGASYPDIIVTVDVANPAPLSVTNTATVTGGSEANTSNNSASDLTNIDCAQDFSLNNTSPLVISRFRENGPGGATDEFVELFNPSSTTHTVASGTCTGGYGVFASAGNGTASNTVSMVCQIPNGTQIPAGGYYLCTGTGYTLESLGRNGGVALATAVGDAPIGCGGSCTGDIPNDAGLALINVGSGGVVNTAGGFVASSLPVGAMVVYDKVGFAPYGVGAPAPGYPSLAGNFCEGGACLQPVGDASLLGTCTDPSGPAGLFPVIPAAPACYGQSGQYELLRRQTTFDATLGTLHQDSNHNAHDFIFVAPNPGSNTGLTITGVAGVTAVLGAAGPYNTSAPPDAPVSTLTRAPFDGADQVGPRNAERSYVQDPNVANAANDPLGTFALRFKYTNNSGAAISGVRFQVDNLATLCGAQTGTPGVGSGEARNLSATPDCGVGSLTSILKVLNSAAEVLVDSSGTAQTVNGTVMEDLSVAGALPPLTPAPGPLSPLGGGVDNTLVVNPSTAMGSVGDGVTGGTGNYGTAIGTSGPSKVLRIKVKFGVVRSGRFVLLIIPMAKTSPTP